MSRGPDSIGQRYVDHAGAWRDRPAPPTPITNPGPDTPLLPTPLTAAEYDAIKERTGRLFMLYNLCAARGLGWRSEHKEVRDLMEHLDQHFPGNDLVVLLAEVSRLRSLLEGQQAASGQIVRSEARQVGGGGGTDRTPTWYVDNRSPPPVMTEAEERALLAKAPEERTRSEVWYLKTRRAVYGGCCNDFADNSGCDCEERALPG